MSITSRRPTIEAGTGLDSEDGLPPEPVEDSFTIHEKLVAYIHAINSDPEPRSGVWMEHSYARAKSASQSASHGIHGATRTLLVRRPRYRVFPPPPPHKHVDVVTVDDVAVQPPDPPPELEEEEDMEEDDWEEKLLKIAPSVLMRKALVKVAAILKSLRLSRLCQAGGKRDETRSHGRLLRRALAPLWGAVGGSRPAAWLHAALTAPGTLPPHYRRLLRDLLAELARSAPALAARLPAPPPAAPDPAPRPGPAVMPLPSRPLLVWVGCGRERTDARWQRRFRPLLPLHYVRIPSAPAADPVAWCGAALAGARASLAALEAGGECALLCVGGAGAGARLAHALALGDGRVKALLQLAPPIITAEGPIGGDDDLPPVRIPALAVIPENSCGAWWAGTEGGAGAGAGARAASLVVGGADWQLRLPHARRRQLRAPQHAVDAAIADECARWLQEVLEGAESDNSEDTRSNTTSMGMEIEDEEFSHLPPLINEREKLPKNCSIEINEGRVISRAAGGTPLPLLPPRRAPRAPAPAPSHQDIMNMPVVLADSPTITHNVSGNNKAAGEKARAAPRYTKVIIAKRGLQPAAAAAGNIVIHSEVRLSPANAR